MKLPKKIDIIKKSTATVFDNSFSHPSTGQELQFDRGLIHLNDQINQLIDYLAEKEKFHGETVSQSDLYGETVTVPSLPHEPVTTTNDYSGMAKTISMQTKFEKRNRDRERNSTPLFTEENISVGAHTRAIGSEPLDTEYRLHVYKSFDTREAVQQAREALFKLED